MTKNIEFIPFNKPYMAKNTLRYINEVLQSGHLQGGGPFSKRAEEKISVLSGGGQVFLTTSCTQSLEMATLLLDLQPGDEVIMPSFTFTSAATALVNFGVVPVFVDVDMKDLNIDVALIESAITSKTRAISVVNYAGVPCNYLELRKIAEAYRLRIIEDNAHGFGGITPNGRLGSFGDVATLSFHATKNIQCGEGGALIVNSRELVDRAYILQEKGTNRRAFIKGQVEKYQWFDKGGSYLLSEILAAQLIAQLEEYDFIQSSRVEAWNRYRTEFLATLESSDWSIPGVQNGNVGHMFYLLAPTGQRDSIQRHLSENGIESTFHYQSLHASEAGKEFGRAIGQFRVSDFASSNLIRLPLWVGICETELQVISKNLIGSNF